MEETRQLLLQKAREELRKNNYKDANAILESINEIDRINEDSVARISKENEQKKQRRLEYIALGVKYGIGLGVVILATVVELKGEIFTTMAGKEGIRNLFPR